MRVVLWDTGKLDVSKDFAGGYGVGNHPGGTRLRDKIIRYFYTRDRRPVALLYAHLAAIFRRLGHRVEYARDRIPEGADLYIFCPSLITLDLERRVIARLLRQNPAARVLVVGLVASMMPEEFSRLDVTVVKGDSEQLLWRLKDVLDRPSAVVQLGTIEDLDSLPFPDWSPFPVRRFRIGYDFWKFPTALIQASRGCSFKCNYCPYVIQENSVRSRDPEAVADEIRHGVRRWGFRSFKFRDPLFGLDRKAAFRLAELIGRLPQKIQFSIETRIDLMRPEMLHALQRVGLTGITVGIETPDNRTLRKYRRAPIREDHQQEFIATCRQLGIRTVAGFMIGFPDDTTESIRGVLRYAKLLNPTFANFNVVTPYPGTEFFKRMTNQIVDFNYSHYTVYTPLLKYRHLSTEQVESLLATCFRRFYFRWKYLGANAHLLWPGLQTFGIGRQPPVKPGADPARPGVPQPLRDLEALHSRGLRQDGPHPNAGLPDQAAGRRISE